MSRASRRTVWIAAALAAAAVGLSCREEPVPPALVGVWRTDDPSHRDRTLEIREDELVFGRGDFSPSVHLLTGIETQPASSSAAAATRYTLHYRGEEGDEQMLRLEHHDGEPAFLLFGDRSQRWVRERDAPSQEEDVS